MRNTKFALKIENNMKKVCIITKILLLTLVGVFVFTSCQNSVEDEFLQNAWNNRPKECSVVFDANGGSGTMQTQKVLSTSLSNTNLDANSFTKDGYLFAGWNTKSDGSGISFVNQNPLSPVFLSTTELSITLYAQWSLIYKVVFDPNGGSGTMTAIETTEIAGKTLTANVFTRSGYVFDGWNTASDGCGTSFSDGTALSTVFGRAGAVVTLYARWVKLYTVSFNANGGTGSMPSITVREDELAGKTLPVNTFVWTDHLLKKWNTADDRSGLDFEKDALLSDVFAFSSDVTLYAQWVMWFDLSTHDISELQDYLSRTIDTTSADNEVVISGVSMTNSDLHTLSDAIKAYQANIGKLDLSELQITEFFNSGSGSAGTGIFQKLTSLKEVILPKTLITVSEGAFCYCDELEKVTLYDGLRTILWDGFSHCPKLKSITIPDSVVLIDQAAFYLDTELEEVIISKNSQLQTIGWHAFYGCSSLKSFYVPRGVTALNNKSTDCSTHFSGEGNTDFSGTFYGCTSLQSVTLEKTLIRINAYVFVGCTALTDVYYAGTEEEWNAIEIRTGNNYLTSATMHYNYTE